MISSGNEFAKNMLTAFANFIHGTPKVHLAAAAMPIGPDMDPSDFLEATFTGYTAGGIQYDISSPTIDPTDLRPSILVTEATTGHPLSFTVGSPVTVSNTIYGYWIDDGSTPPTVIAAEQFDTPILMDASGKNITILPKLKSLGLDGPAALED